MTRGANTVRIVIVDDHALFREVLRKVLEDQPDLRVVGELSDGRGVCDLLESSQADLLLLDLDMPRLNGYEVLRQLRGSELEVDTIVLTASQDRIELSLALELGAKGVVPKKAASAELLMAIRQVHQGLTWLDRSIRGLEPHSRLEDIYDQRHTHEALRPGPEGWEDPTPRETEVAALVAEGLRYKEIAQRLQMSPSTLNNHLRSIFEKLQVHGRVELALYGLRRK